MSTMPSLQRVQLRLHPKLRDMWPPEPGGAYQKGGRVPLDLKDVLTQVFYFAPVERAKADVSLKTSYEGAYHTRDILLDDPNFARILADRLRKEIGKTIEQIGQLEVDF